MHHLMIFESRVDVARDQGRVENTWAYHTQNLISFQLAVGSCEVIFLPKV